MGKYIGTEMVEAVEMGRGDYYSYRGWETPADENPEDGGYLIKYPNGHESWMPRGQFENAYRGCMGMAFGIALELLKNGFRVAREGWCGKGMSVAYQKGYPQGIPCNKQTAETWGMPEGGLFKCEPYLQISTADGSHAMWAPSICDCLAEDWVIVGEKERTL